MGSAIRQLRKMYRVFNSAWFGGRLPKNTILKIVSMYAMGELEVADGDPAIIKISHRCYECGWGSVGLTLFHEMVHLEMAMKHARKIGYNRALTHGKRFQRRMRQLAAKGAFDRLW
jgi:hypothetical protein